MVFLRVQIHPCQSKSSIKSVSMPNVKGHQDASTNATRVRFELHRRNRIPNCPHHVTSVVPRILQKEAGGGGMGGGQA